MRHTPVAIGCAVLALSSALLVLSANDIRAGASTSAPAQDGSCQINAAMVADMLEAEVGSTVALTMTVDADCKAADLGPLHIVFLMQASALMARDPNTGSDPRNEIRVAARGLLDRLHLSANPWIKVGIIEYAEQPNTLCQLTNDRSQLDSCLNSLRATGETRLDAAIRSVASVLKRGRGAPSDSLQEWLVLFGDGVNDYRDPRTPRAQHYTNNPDKPHALLQGCDPVRESASVLMDEFPELRFAVVCLATGCDRTCMREIANPSTYVFDTTNVDRTLYTNIDRTIEQIARVRPIAKVVISHTLSSALSYIADSASPAPDDIDGKTISWLWPNPTGNSFTATLKTRADEPGEVSVCTMASIAVTERNGAVTHAEFDCPTIDISGESATPTPTPTATPEPSPTFTPIVDFVHCEIQGTVYDGEPSAGKEVEGATVSCRHGQPGALQDCGPEQETGADGRFSFGKRLFLGDQVVLRANAPGLTSATATLSAAGCQASGELIADLLLRSAPFIYLPVALRDEGFR